MPGDPITDAIAALLRNTGLSLDAYRDYSRAQEVGDIAGRAEYANQMGQILAYYAQQKALQDYISQIGAGRIFDPEATGETARRTAVGDVGKMALSTGAVGDRARSSTAGRRLGRSADLDALNAAWGKGSRGYQYPATEYLQDTRQQQGLINQTLQNLLKTYGAGMEVGGTKLGHTAPIADLLRMASEGISMSGAAMGGGPMGAGAGQAGAGSANIGMITGLNTAAAGPSAGIGGAMGAGTGALSAGQTASSQGMDWYKLMNQLLRGYAGQFVGG